MTPIDTRHFNSYTPNSNMMSVYQSQVTPEAIDAAVEARQAEMAQMEANIREHKEKVQATLDPEVKRIFNLYAPTYIDLYA